MLLLKDRAGRWFTHMSATGLTRPLPGLTTNDRPLQWSADGRSLFVAREWLPFAKIDRVDVATGQRRLSRKSQENQLAVATLLDNELSSLENQFVEAADAMPEQKYGFKPTNGEFEGVLTFGEQVKHVAFYNYATFAIMLGEKPPAETEAARGPDAVRTKADILKYARESFAAGHRATAAISMQNVTARMKDLPDVAHGETRLQMMMFVLRHAASHYGQMVEYLRMNGIIPPASRPTRQ